MTDSRAVLARYGHQPAPPAEVDCPACEGVPKQGNQPCAVCGRSAPSAESEVADETRYLVKELRDQADDLSPSLELFGLIHRAADLLEQRQSAPVPVSERLPEARDCLGRPTEASDAGWCWTYSDASERWSFQAVVFPRSHPNPPLVTLKPSVTHWLPHYALPLPAGEAQP